MKKVNFAVVKHGNMHPSDILEPHKLFLDFVRWSVIDHLGLNPLTLPSNTALCIETCSDSLFVVNWWERCFTKTGMRARHDQKSGTEDPNWV